MVSDYANSETLLLVLPLRVRGFGDLDIYL